MQSLYISRPRRLSENIGSRTRNWMVLAFAGGDYVAAPRILETMYLSNARCDTEYRLLKLIINRTQITIWAYYSPLATKEPRELWTMPYPRLISRER